MQVASPFQGQGVEIGGKNIKAQNRADRKPNDKLT